LTLHDKETGELCVEIYGFTSRPVPRHEFRKLLLNTHRSPDSLERPEQDQLFAVRWRKQPLSSIEQRGDLPGAWLVLAQSGSLTAGLAIEKMTRSGACVIMVEPGAAYEKRSAQHYVVSPTSRADFDRLCQDLAVPLCGVLHMWALTETGAGEDPPGQEEISCTSAVCLVQALRGSCSATQPPAHLWFITAGAQAPHGPDQSRCNLQNALWGLARVVTIEHPEFHCRCLDLDPQGASEEEADALWQEVTAPHTEEMIARRQRTRYVARLVTHNNGDDPSQNEFSPPPNFELVPSASGLLEELRMQARIAPPVVAGEIRVKIEAAGVNFRDVLISMGLYPGGIVPIGSEFSGTVLEVGEGVADLNTGDAVFGIGSGTFAHSITVPRELVVLKPDHLSFAQAASLPIVFSTVYACLCEIADLKRGETVLVHAGAGGIGLAAIQMAHKLGASVIATAGSARKRDYLKKIGVAHVFDSRSLTFAQAVRKVAAEGVDVVLNSLSGDFIPTSLELLKKGGRFVEIGKRGIWTKEAVAQKYPDVAYDVFALDLQESPRQAVQYLQVLSDWCERGEFVPLPLTQFAVERARQAFRFMQE
ncbi:MAG: zinc-binding dehydrogenase, partial [Terriglobales bacterium]